MKKNKGYACEEYDDLFEDLQEEGCIVDNRSVFGYRMKTITSGEYRECEIYPIFESKQIIQRGMKKKETRKVQRLLNRKNARKALVRLLNTNFHENDIWATFTYDDAHLPKDKEAAHRYFRNFLRRLAYWMEKNGYGELKYIFVTEYVDDGRKVRIHHHLVSNFPDRDICELKWKGGARTQTRRLQPDESGFEGLARYITKSRDFKIKNEKMWSASQNLIRPKVTVSDKAVSRRRMEKMCLSYAEAEDFLRAKNEGYILTGEIEIKFSDYVPGGYIYAKMRLRS
ncbi:MAG: hypothetical protein OSJ39_02180 [Clostridia bacterium]|nr:hypothetical protein [Clostridia bacterium]